MPFVRRYPLPSGPSLWPALGISLAQARDRMSPPSQRRRSRRRALCRWFRHGDRRDRQCRSQRPERAAAKNQVQRRRCASPRSALGTVNRTVQEGQPGCRNVIAPRRRRRNLGRSVASNHPARSGSRRSRRPSPGDRPDGRQSSPPSRPRTACNSRDRPASRCRRGSVQEPWVSPEFSFHTRRRLQHLQRPTHLVSAHTHRELRAVALTTWRTAVASA